MRCLEHIRRVNLLSEVSCMVVTCHMLLSNENHDQVMVIPMKQCLVTFFSPAKEVSTHLRVSISPSLKLNFRSANVSPFQDNYHSIFGYMEDLYNAHEQLWTYTFEPCLNKVSCMNTFSNQHYSFLMGYMCFL